MGCVSHEICTTVTRHLISTIKGRTSTGEFCPRFSNTSEFASVSDEILVLGVRKPEAWIVVPSTWIQVSHSQKIQRVQEGNMAKSENNTSKAIAHKINRLTMLEKCKTEINDESGAL